MRTKQVRTIGVILMADLDLTKLREIAESPTCPNHREVQHRDRKPPWCPDCGWNRGRPAVPPRQIDARADTDTEGTDDD